MRGEKENAKEKKKEKKGSPPHARGKVLVNASPASMPRITPACAGKRRAIRESQCLE